MLWLNILIGIILVIFLILLIPVGVRAQYDEDFLAELKIGFVTIRLYPPKPKKPKKKKEKKKKPAPEKKEEKKEEKEKKPSLLKEKGIGWFVDLLRQVAALAAGVMRDFFKHLVIRNMQVSITYSGSDAGDTAVKYGCLCLSVYPAVSILADVAKCRHYGVDIAPNFDEDAKSVYFADIQVQIRIIWVVGLVFRHGFKVIRLLLALRRGKTGELDEMIEKNKELSNKGECDMEHPIGSLMNITMEKIKEMVDVNTIVGTPITAADGTLIIPVSKVSYGFASGGSDLPTKKENKDCFGGGSGAGVTIQPVAFLTVYQGNVRLISVNGDKGALDNIVSMIPDVVDKVKGFVSERKKKKENTEIAENDDFSEITADDIDI